MQKAGVAHKINFIESQAIPALDKLLEEVNPDEDFELRTPMIAFDFE